MIDLIIIIMAGIVLLFLLSCCFMVARLLDEEISMYGYEGKGKNPYKVGKQSYKELKSQGSGLSNIEITDGNIKSFERVAKKYRLDFALKKDSSTKPPTYYVFFKGQDTEMMNLAFKKYLGVQMNKKDKPSIMKKLMHFKDAVSKGKNRERAREQQKDRVYKIPMVRMFALAGGLTNLRMYRSKRRPRRNVWVR